MSLCQLTPHGEQCPHTATVTVTLTARRVDPEVGR